MFLEPRKRSEQALVAVVQEAYVNGVSTRKVERLVEQLGIHRSGLAAALRDLAKTHSARGLETSVVMPERISLDEKTEQLLFRCAQEALRNTYKHANATTSNVTLRHCGGRLVMEVADDGCGLDPTALDHRPAEGHFGLSIVRDLVTDAGGRLDVDSAPGRGVTVRVDLPARPCGGLSPDPPGS